MRRLRWVVAMVAVAVASAAVSLADVALLEVVVAAARPLVACHAVVLHLMLYPRFKYKR